MMEWVVMWLRLRGPMTTAALHAALIEGERKRRGVKDRARSARNSLARALRSLTAAGTIKCEHGLWSPTAPDPDDVEAEREKKKSLTAVAHHEAGHAVAGLAGGLHMTVATIGEAGTGARGYVTGLTDRIPVGRIDVPPTDKDGRPIGGAWRTVANLSKVDAFGNKITKRKISEAEHHAEIVMCIAGGMAHCIHLGKDHAAWRTHASGADMWIARDHRRKLGGKARSWERYTADTFKVLTKHWEKVEAVAKALQKKNVMTAYDLDRVLVGVVRRHHLKKAKA
jgi:hypothetical protein